MKKAIISLALVALIISAMSVSALAHCGGRGNNAGYNSRQTNANYSYELCPVEDCYLPGIHEHDGTYYRCAHIGACGGYNEGYCGGYGYYNNGGEYDSNSGNYNTSSGYRPTGVSRHGYVGGCVRSYYTAA